MTIWLCITFLLTASITHYLKSRIADHSVETFRDFVVIHDLRSLTHAMQRTQKNDFEEIKWIKNSKVERVVPAKIGDSEEYSIGTLEIARSIYFDEDQRYVIGRFVFSIDLFQNVGIAFGLWLLGVLVSLPLLTFSYRGQVSQQNREIEARENKMIAQTARLLAHDLRKPFNKIDALLVKMKKSNHSNGDDKGLHEIEQDISSSSDYLSGLLSDLMDYGRSFNLRVQPTDLRLLVEDVRRSLDYLENSKSVEIENCIESEIFVGVDSLKMKRVFSNLLTNALEATSDSDRVWVEAQRTKGKMQVTVGNTGMPIKSEDLEKVFSPSFSKKSDGTGFGLSIVRQMLRAHGSEVKVTSTEAGETQFIFELEESQGLKNRASSNDKRPFPEDTYLLEDNLYLATKVIKEVGIDQKNYFRDPEIFCEVWAASSSNIVVVTDYLFDSSQKTGYHVAVHVKAIHPSAQVVLFSDFPIPEKEREMFDRICPKSVPTLNILLGQLSNSPLSE